MRMKFYFRNYNLRGYFQLDLFVVIEKSIHSNLNAYAVFYILFAYRIVLFYLQYLPQTEKFPENLLQGDK